MSLDRGIGNLSSVKKIERFFGVPPSLFQSIHLLRGDSKTEVDPREMAALGNASK